MCKFSFLVQEVIGDFHYQFALVRAIKESVDRPGGYKKPIGNIHTVLDFAFG
jgi:hypothetical protein